MTDYTDIAARIALDGLNLLGGFHPEPADGLPKQTGTLLLLGPGDGFWEIFAGSDEYSDGLDNPMDRWSLRVIGALATELEADALYPFGGPPHHAFYSWAVRTGRIWSSPVALLVHDQDGLMVSFRGALAFSDRIRLPQPPDHAPCVTCDAPCRDACPVGALSLAGYDVPACKVYLESPPGYNCMSEGCQVRRACPLSANRRSQMQNAFHMANFHPKAVKTP